MERSVNYIRGRAFTSRVDFATTTEDLEWLDMIINTINQYIGSVSTQNKANLTEVELSSLQPSPGEFGCFEIAEYKSDTQSTFCINNNHYSVPDHLAGERVIVQLYSEKLVIFDKNHRKVATHEHILWNKVVKYRYQSLYQYLTKENIGSTVL